MNALSQQKLLMIAAILAALRFVVVPLFDWQAAQLEQLQVATAQLERAIRLKNSAPAQAEQLQQLESAKAELLKEYPVATQSAQFRLQMQQQLQQQFTATGLQVSLFEWLSQENIQNDMLERHYASVDVTGNPALLMQVFSQELARKPWLKVKELRLRQRSGAPIGETSAELTIELTALRQPSRSES